MEGFCHLFITPSGVRTFLVSGGHCNNARDTSLVLLYSRELTKPGYVGTITNLKSSSQNPKMELNLSETRQALNTFAIRINIFPIVSCESFIGIACHQSIIYT